MNKVDLPALIEKFNVWVARYIWSANTLIELLAISVSFILGAIVGRFLWDKATRAIEASNLPLRTKRIAKSARRVFTPTASLAVLYLFSKVASSEFMGLDVSLSIAVMKTLLAWIAIRLSLLFIENGTVRSGATWAIWLIAALSIFGVLDETTSALEQINFTVGAMSISMLEIIKGLVMLVVLLYLALFVSTFFERKVLQSKTISRSSQVLMVKIIRMVLVFVAVIIGFTSSGIDLSIFTVFSGAVGLGIGFGLQRSASNLFSGLMLLMDQSIKPGDVIELDQNGTFGWVNKMAARYTEVITRDNKSYLIPNEEFITQRVVNWSHGNSLIRLDIVFGVHYDSDPHEIIRIAQEVAKIPPRVAKDPQPLCYIKEFGDSAINFTLRFWITDAEHGLTNIKGEVFLGLWDAFKKHGIKIPYPHREIFVHQT